MFGLLSGGPWLSRRLATEAVACPPPPRHDYYCCCYDDDSDKHDCSVHVAWLNGGETPAGTELSYGNAIATLSLDFRLLVLHNTSTNAAVDEQLYMNGHGAIAAQWLCVLHMHNRCIHSCDRQYHARALVLR